MKTEKSVVMPKDGKTDMEENFKFRLRTIREEIGVNQQEFADALEVSRAAIGYYESGKRLPDIYFLQKLCQITGCSPDYFLNGGNKVHISNDYFENNELTDYQLQTLSALIRSPSFRAILSEQQPMRELFGYVDGLAEYGIEYKNEILGVLVSRAAAARFASIIEHAYLILDHQARFDQKYNIERKKNPDILHLSEEKRETFIELVERFRDLHKQEIRLSNEEWRKRRFPPSATNIDSQTPNEKFEAYRQKLKELADGRQSNA